MILKIWNEKTNTWILKDNFVEIHYSKSVDEEKELVERKISCYYPEENYSSCIITDTKSKGEDFPAVYILNNEGKTVERI